MRPGDPADAARSAEILLRTLQRNEDGIRDALKGYTTRPHVDDELRRSRQLLESIRADPGLFTARVPSGAGMMPRNQLLYSLVYMGFVPALFCDRFTIRAPTAAVSIVQKLVETLTLADIAPALELGAPAYREFVTRSARAADFVVFTGSSETANHVRAQLTGAELFIAGGAGHNPVLVKPDADLGNAARRIVGLSLYNQGQDCSAPSAILCPAAIAGALQHEIAMALSVIRDRDRDLPVWERTVGPNTDARHVGRVRQWLAGMRPWVALQGEIDEATRVIAPTVIIKPLSTGPVYREWFAPVIVIQPYTSVAQLRGYFLTRTYNAQAMYLTKFGRDALHDPGALEIHPPDTVLQDVDLHDHERGDRPYGGYGPDASYLAIGRLRVSGPVLPQREIATHVVAYRSEPVTPTHRRPSPPASVSWARTHSHAELRARYENLPPGCVSADVVSVAGRVTSVRNGGMFVDIDDGTASLQLQRDKPFTAHAGVMDLMSATGAVARTRSGELTVVVSTANLVWAAPQRLRAIHRPSRLLAQAGREAIRSRARVFEALRDVLRAERFLEVPFPTSANALVHPSTQTRLRCLLVEGTGDRVCEFTTMEPDADHSDVRSTLRLLASFVSRPEMRALFERLVRAAFAAATDGAVSETTFAIVPGSDAVSTHVGAESIQLTWHGVRLGAISAELTDPSACRLAWQEEFDAARRRGDFDVVIDEAHIEALERGMPPSYSMTIDVDALVETARRCAAEGHHVR